MTMARVGRGDHILPARVARAKGRFEYYEVFEKKPVEHQLLQPA